ncbi:MAG: hypothetical protein HY471_00385 [Candidatus Sungbacteria bacterium]|nr:hypothetical protein [Candidatus Sungbacteria bacterium]
MDEDAVSVTLWNLFPVCHFRLIRGIRRVGEIVPGNLRKFNSTLCRDSLGGFEALATGFGRGELLAEAVVHHGAASAGERKEDGVLGHDSPRALGDDASPLEQGEESDEVLRVAVSTTEDFVPAARDAHVFVMEERARAVVRTVLAVPEVSAEYLASRHRVLLS